MSIATCGHETPTEQDEICCIWKSTDREGNKAYSYGVLCKECYDEYLKEDMILKTQEEADKWLATRKFYVYRQNNSGGNFVINDILTFYVVIEAATPESADIYAESVGIYFDGVESGEDCECCGDRWARASEWDAIDSLEHPSFIYNLRGYGDNVIACYVYYKDGSKETIKGTYR